VTFLPLLVAVLLALAAPAHAQTSDAPQPTTQATSTLGTNTTPLEGPTDYNAISRPERMDVKPKDHRLDGNAAKAIGLRDPTFAAERRRIGGTVVDTYLKGQTRWQVSAYKDGKEVAQVIIDDRTAKVTESWTGPQVAWTMARGYEGAFGRKVNAPYVWLPLAALFLLGMVERRRRSWRHLDAAVITAFGGVYALFCAARIDLSVPLVYPFLGYVLVRLLAIGLGRARPPEWRPLVPAAWLSVGLAFLVAFRAVLNVVESNVIDVGYAGVIGAQKLVDGAQLWGAFPPDNPSGDTYGPVAYLAYIPFEQLWPWTSGRWDDLWAAHALAITADLACLALLYLIGRRVRDHGTGIRLAFLWAACPFTLLVMNTGSNDGLVGALILGAILAAASGPARGFWLALAGWTKLAPLALGPLFLMHGRRDTRLPFVLAFAGVTVLSAAVVLRWGDAAQFLDRTLLFQADRDAPFSVWGAWGWDTAQRVVQVAGVVLALAVAFVPRRRDVVGLAALAAAVLVLLQAGTGYWFFTYLGWWLGPLLIAVGAVPRPAPAQAPDEAIPAPRTASPLALAR
jgi:hypothetical protein